MNQILNIGFIISGFTILTLLVKHNDKKQIKYAILLLSLWFIRFLAHFLKDQVDLVAFPFLIVFDQSLFFLDGVLLYWYINSFLSKQKIYIQLAELIPFFLSFLLSLRIYFCVSAAKLAALYQEAYTQLTEGKYEVSSSVIVYIMLIIIYNSYFYFRSLKLLKSYKNYLTDNFSSLLNLKVNWLQNLTYFWLVFLMIPLILFFLNYIFAILNNPAFEIVFFTGMLLTSIFFAVNVIDQQYLLPEQFTELEQPIKTNGTSIETSQTFETLTQYMEVQKPFKNESLTLKKLSELVQIKPAKLSSAINIENKTNFHEYINTYRIESVKKELITTSEQIIIIAYRNGFNSKSTFNSVFKKKTGMTPSAYRKKYENTPKMLNKS